MWPNIIFLTRKELKNYPIPMLITMLFFVLSALVVGGMIRSSTQLSELSGFERGTELFLQDWILLAVLTMLGFAFTKDYLTYNRTDPFSKKLAFYRRLPIRDAEIVISRYLVMLTNLVLCGAVFFIVLYYSSDRLGDKPDSLAAYVGICILWICWSLVQGAINIYLELGKTGKVYFWTNVVIMLGYLIIVVWLTRMDVHLISGSIHLVNHNPAATLITAVITAMLSIWTGIHSTIRRLAVRDLL